MQQTQNLKLNLIETSDPLSPAPLNENTSTLDAALAALDETAADLTQRMIALENCRMVAGWYQGNGDNNGITIDLGERPLAVMVMGRNSYYSYVGFVTGDSTTNSQNSVDLEIVDNGFQVGGYLNGSNSYYCYIAFLGGWETRDFPKPKT